MDRGNNENVGDNVIETVDSYEKQEENGDNRKKENSGDNLTAETADGNMKETLANLKVPQKTVSLFALFPPYQKSLILAAASLVALITPFTDTIYLPALTSVGTTLDASASSVSATVSAYLGAVGLGQIIWGPLSDRFGRTIILFSGLALYACFTIACIFANNINTLIALRTLEGFIVASTIATASAAIADVYLEEEMGTAMGAYMLPILIGPILAPLVGGAVSQAFSWRATFVLLLILFGPIALFAVCVLPETHHYFVLKMIRKSNKSHGFPETDQIPQEREPAAAEEMLPTEINTGVALTAVRTTDPDIEEGLRIENGSTTGIANHNGIVPHLPSRSEYVAPTLATMVPETVILSTNMKENVIHVLETNIIPPPKMMAPWLTIYNFEFDAQLAPSYFLNSVFFAALFVSLTVLPLRLPSPPYSLNETIIGICFLPVGVIMMIGAAVGGYFSDVSAAKYTNSPEGRLVYSIPGMWLVPLGCIGFGFCLKYGVNLGAVLITQCVIGLGQSLVMPASQGYMYAVRPHAKGAVGSVLWFNNFAGAAVLISIQVSITDAIGVDMFFVILCGVSVIACLWSTFDICNKVFN